jgi:hypothetical protein
MATGAFPESCSILIMNLAGLELEDFRSHLTACSVCRKRLEKEQALSTKLHETRLLYLAPPGLRESVAAAATQASLSCSREP